MEYTTKQFIESNRFPQIKVVYGEGYLDKRISGIRIIEIPEMVKYLEGGEILLTSLWVYKECRYKIFRTILGKKAQWHYIKEENI